MTTTETRCESCGTALRELNLNATGELLCLTCHLATAPEPNGDQPTPETEKLLSATKESPVAESISALPFATLRRLDVARMVAEQPPDVPWVVEGLAVEGCLTLVSGREGEGKSLVSAAAAVAVAAGHRLAGMNCRQGTALVVDAENGAFEIHRRVHALGVPASGVEVVEADGHHLGRDLGELAGLIGELHPDLVILDSFRSLWPGGEENDSAAVAAALDPLRNLLRAERSAGVLVHHLGRRGVDYRGSTAIGAAVELGFRLDRAPDDPERAYRRRLTCWKCRPAPEPACRWLQLHVERGRVYVDSAEPYSDGEEAAQPERPARSELAPTMLAAAVNPIRWGDLAEALGRHRSDGTLHRLRRELLETGELAQIEDGKYVATGAGVANPLATEVSGSSKPDAAVVATLPSPYRGRESGNTSPDDDKSGS